VDDPHAGESSWTAVCPVSRLIEQMFVCAKIGEAEVLLIWDEGRAVACERACPHEQADLSQGRLSNGRLLCPRHAASFDLDDGTITSGWPSRSLQVREGRIWIDAAVRR
jgi:3-phenylpropionate/trans-cinnamate dioxygenase ferredoxin component